MSHDITLPTTKQSSISAKIGKNGHVITLLSFPAQMFSLVTPNESAP